MTAQDILQILTKTCGAPSDTRDFLYHVGEYLAGRVNHPLEYRFCGKLGFGGKLRLRDGEAPRVDCYQEDETPLRYRMMVRANKKLAALFSQMKL